MVTWGSERERRFDISTSFSSSWADPVIMCTDFRTVRGLIETRLSFLLCTVMPLLLTSVKVSGFLYPW